MPPINIKIKKDSLTNAEPSANVLNLNRQPPQNPGKNRLKKYLWLSLFLLAAETLFIAAIYLKQSVASYAKIIPRRYSTIAYFSQSQIADLTRSAENRYSSPVMEWLKNRYKNLLDKTGIDSANDLLNLFNDSMAIALLPADNDQYVNWLFLASVKTDSQKFNEIKEKTERAIKQNFNITAENYRQISITKIQNLNQGPQIIHYAQVKNYFIAANSFGALKETIDSTIK